MTNKYQNMSRQEVIDLGNKVIFPNPPLKKKWEEATNESFNGFSQGKIIKDALEIIDAIDKGCTSKEAVDILNNQDHSGASYNSVRNIVLIYSKDGYDFWMMTKSGELTDQELNKVLSFQARNQRYKESLKKDNINDQFNLRIDLLEKGHKLVQYDQDIQDEWDNFVEESLKKDKTGSNCKNILKVCYQLQDRNNLKYGYMILDSLNLDKDSLNKLRKQVAYFSNLGPEFYLATTQEPLTKKEKDFLLDIYSRNIELNETYINENGIKLNKIYDNYYTPLLEKELGLNQRKTKNTSIR